MAAHFVALWVPSEVKESVGRLGVLTPARCDSVDSSRVPQRGGAIADTLPSAIRQELLEFRAHGQPWLLCLDRSISDLWQYASWESLQLEGEPIPSFALVVRKAVPQFTIGNKSVPRGRAAWLDLFPRQEFDFRKEFQSQVAAERLSRIRIEWLFQGVDGYDDLFILAHGGENGLLDVNEGNFSLETSALPRRVWLLACNKDLAMFRLASSLLERGVGTVVAATGEISAAEMAALVTSWVDRETTESLESWLLTRRGMARTVGGIRALTIFGNVTLDDSEAASWNGMTWSDRDLPDGSSWRLKEEDPLQLKAALRAIDAHGLWEQTFQWLLPKAMAAAENSDHEVMLLLQRRAKAVEKSPALLHALAIVSYRLGHYDLAARYVTLGLASRSIAEIERADLLADLTMLLIDMNCPDSATHVADAHEQVMINDSELRGWHDFKRLDWRARIAFRRSEFALAIQLMSAKRRQNPNPSDTRELASLLYMQSWCDRAEGSTSAEARSWGGEVIHLLAHLDQTLLGKGNDNGAYLLRALACYGWATRDERVFAVLHSWLPKVRNELASIDPGPWAFSLAYLCLAGIEPKAQMNNALAALERQGYYLEAAAFAQIANQAERSRASIAKFDDRRMRVVSELMNINAILGLHIAFGREDYIEKLPTPI